MKEVYKRIGIYSLGGGIVLLLLAIAYWLLFWSGFEESGEMLFTFLLTGLASLGSGWFFTKASSGLQNEGKPSMQESSFGLDELIFQHIPSFFPKTILMSNTGQPLYEISPTERQPLKKWFSVFNSLSRGLLFPLTYDVITAGNARVASFTYKNEWKRVFIFLWGQEDELIGHFELPGLKDPLKNKAKLYDAEGHLWRVLEAKNMSGDMDVIDDMGCLTASYRFGIFPYALHPAFQAMSHHEYVKLDKNLSDNEKRAYLAVFFYWLRQ